MDITQYEKLFLHLFRFKNRNIICLISLVSFIFLLLGMDLYVNVYDEGLILVGADRVIYGDIPHRDFYCNYGPAQFYVLAALFKIFSPSVLVERIWDTVVRTSLVIMVFVILEHLTSRMKSIFVSVITLFCLSAFEFYGYPVFPALLFSLASVYFLFLFFKGERASLFLFLGGICAGIVTLFRYDVGFITCLIETSVLSAYVISASQQDMLLRFAKLIPIYLGGIAAVLLPVAGIYIKYGVIGDFINDIVYYPTTYYADMRSLPFPRFHSGYNILIYLPLIVWFLSITILVKTRRQNIDSVKFWAVILLTLLSIGFYAKGLVRVSVIHMALSIIPSLVLLPVVLNIETKFDNLTKIVALLSAFICIYASGVILVNKALNTRNSLFSQLSSDVWRNIVHHGAQENIGLCSSVTGLERLACFKIDKKRIDTINYLQIHTNGDDYIYSGTTRHDKIFVNDIALYFISNRRPTTKWHHFDPGLQTTENIQKEMIKEFEKNMPPLVVLESEWDNVVEPNKSAYSSRIKILDTYIKNNYRDAAFFGDIKIMQRY